jgi:CubicO group peptidase (beta-lactamase class C family)
MATHTHALKCATVAVIAFAALASCSTTNTHRDAAEAARVAARIEQLRNEKRIPGLAIVMVRGTQVVFARGCGYADVAKQVAVTPDTPFNTASVSKPVSAVVALRLVEKALLDLDRPMREFANFPEFCRDATAAGGIFFGDYRCDDARLTMRRVLSMSANGEPGSRFLYNPPSYSWASRPMAEVAGRPFSDLVGALVFEPAGMKDSARIHRKLPLSTDLAARLALPYRVAEDGSFMQAEPPPPQGDGAAGGVIASAMDLARFDIALSQGKLLSDASRAMMWEPTRATDGTSMPYGIGWFVSTWRGHRVAWHTGLWEGRYSALYLTVLDEPRSTLILLANSEGLRWPSELDEAAIERSPFAVAFLEAFAR